MHKKTDGEIERGKPLVAVVDDDEAACLSLSQMLRLRGYRVQMFSSAEAALSWPELPDSDCILTDVKNARNGRRGVFGRAHPAKISASGRHGYRTWRHLHGGALP